MIIEVEIRSFQGFSMCNSARSRNKFLSVSKSSYIEGRLIFRWNFCMDACVKFST